MDELDAFFDCTTPLVRKTIPGGTTNGRIVSAPEPQSSDQSSEFDSSSNYAQPHKEENDSILLASFASEAANRDGVKHNPFDSSDDDDDDGIDPIYLQYNFNERSTNQNLPITFYKSQILCAIRENPFVILQGATGCGKTTQVPQFILDEACTKQKRCNIVVAQPRRIAAVSNAERVASERSWPPTTVVGYQIGMDEKKNCSEATRILFCTTGILLEKLIHRRDFLNYTHIILDEVHERNKDMDFLFIVIRRLFATTLPKPKVKIILMSATIDARLFANYFTIPKNGVLVPAPIVLVEQKSKFTVSEFYLESFCSVAPDLEKIKFNFEEPGIPAHMYTLALYLINRCEHIDVREKLTSADHALDKQRLSRPTVLIFLPGINEINRMYAELNDNWSRLNNRTKIMCIVLHSTSSEQQRAAAMQRSDANVRKIILATNIAESSITVPDVKYVLDFCLARVLVTDRNTNFSSLRLKWAAHSNCRQRAGRTGRVMNGRCYRFVTKHFYENIMSETATPELISSPLENIVLKAKMLDMGSPQAILALAMDTPKLADIASTVLVLKEIGGLLRTCDRKVTDLDGDISFIGRIMANLPIDVKISKFIILGYCFSVLEECITIGAALNCSKSLLKLNNQTKDEMKLYAQKLQWANGSGSDLFAMLHAYKTWEQLHNRGYFGMANNKEERENMLRAEQKWADKTCLDLAALYECKVTIDELTLRLERLQIKQTTGVNRVQWTDNEKSIILKVVIAGAFYPNYFARSSPHKDNYARDAFKCIGGRDPRNTVYYAGFSREHVRCLYTKSIKEIFVRNGIVKRDALSSVQVSFENGANKAFVTFKTFDNDNSRYVSMPGKIQTEVYKSIKMRTLRIPSKIPVIKTTNKALEYAKECGLTIPNDGSFRAQKSVENLDQICTPRILDRKIRGFVTHVETCSQFWFQPIKQSGEVSDFQNFLNRFGSNVVKPLSVDESIFIGKLLIVKLESMVGDNINYHRAKVLHIESDAKRTTNTVDDNVYRIQLIDSGEILACKFNRLHKYCGESKNFINLPPRCFECSLAELQASQLNSENGFWPKEAIILFKNKINNKEVELEIYSVTNGKANVFILCPESLQSINDILITNRFAEYTEEDFISKCNHNHRRTQQQYQQMGNSVENYIDPMFIDYLNDENAYEIDAPPKKMCGKEVILRGPNSPLEINLFAVTEAGRNRNVIIDRYSINSVILENDLQDLTEKYLIAASVCDMGGDRKDMSVRQTTLLPNIRGFGPLMALIFCPTMQVKLDAKKTHYTAIRTGLGYDDIKQRPMFEEHDIVFNLDVEIVQEDIEEINQIRYCMDSLLLTQPGEETAEYFSDDIKRRLTIKIKELIVKLLEKPRKSIEISMDDHKWNPNEAQSRDFIVSHSNEIYGDRAIFPLHNTLKTETERDSDRHQLHMHCKELHDLTKICHGLSLKIACKLCSVKLDSIPQLELHLISRLHCDNERRIHFRT